MKVGTSELPALVNFRKKSKAAAAILNTIETNAYVDNSDSFIQLLVCVGSLR